MVYSPEQELKLKGYKLTSQRKALLREFVLAENHLLSADKIDKRLKEINKPIDLSTIYRNLEIFLQAGIIKKLSFEGQVDQYKLNHTKGHHHHVVCMTCGKTQVFKNCPVIAIEKQLEKELQFKPINHRLEILGYCKECTENND